MAFVPDWQLPPGVTRSLWEFAEAPHIARDEAAHIANSPLLAWDFDLLRDWFPEPCSLLDLGCGTGRISVPLAQRGFQVLGVDLSHSSLQMARRHADETRGSVGLIRANLCELHCVPEGSFDGALLMFATLGMIRGPEHRRNALQHAVRALRAGGRLALHVHNVWRHWYDSSTRFWLLADRFRALCGRTAGDTHRDYRGIPQMYHHAFSYREITRLLSQAGLQVTDARTVLPDVEPVRDGSWRQRNFQAEGWFILAEKRGSKPPRGQHRL